jgi:CRP-like cAMP-binding protein
MQRTYQFDGFGFTKLSNELAQRLTADGLRHHFSDGVLFQQQGDDGNGLWLIEAGQVKICRFGSDGDLTVFAVLGPGDIIGELSFFAGTPRQNDAVADGAVCAIWISAGLLNRLLASNPDLSLFLLQSLAKQLGTALNRLDEQRNLSATARLARALANLAGGEGEKIRCTQQELSDFVGVSRVTTGQILTRFEDAGLIERGYGWIELTNADLLRSGFG